MSAESYCVLAVEYPDKASGSGLSTIEFDRLPEAAAIAAIKSPPPELLARLKPGLFITARREDQRRTVVAFARGLRGRGKTAIVTEDGCFVNGVRTQAGVGLRQFGTSVTLPHPEDWHVGWMASVHVGQLMTWVLATRVSPRSRVMALVAAWQFSEIKAHMPADFKLTAESTLLGCVRWANGQGPLPPYPSADDIHDARIGLIRLIAASQIGKGGSRPTSFLSLRLDETSLDRRRRMADAIRSIITFPQLVLSGMGYPQ